MRLIIGLIANKIITYATLHACKWKEEGGREGSGDGREGGMAGRTRNGGGREEREGASGRHKQRGIIMSCGVGVREGCGKGEARGGKGTEGTWEVIEEGFRGRRRRGMGEGIKGG